MGEGYCWNFRGDGRKEKGTGVGKFGIFYIISNLLDSGLVCVDSRVKGEMGHQVGVDGLGLFGPGFWALGLSKSYGPDMM